MLPVAPVKPVAPVLPVAPVKPVAPVLPVAPALVTATPFQYNVVPLAYIFPVVTAGIPLVRLIPLG